MGTLWDTPQQHDFERESFLAAASATSSGKWDASRGPIHSLESIHLRVKSKNTMLQIDLYYIFFRPHKNLVEKLESPRPRV